MKLIDKDAVLAIIDEKIQTCANQREEMILVGCDTLVGDATARAGELQFLRDSINTLEVKEVDLELITGWFDHVAQMADDRKTLNGEVMEDWAALDEIKCLAKNSSEFITKHYKAQKGE